MNKHFAIAYSDKNGNSYTQSEPWLLDDFDSINECFTKSKEMITDGYQNVTIFELDTKSHETISWEYVKQRAIN